MSTFLVTLTVPNTADELKREGIVTVLHPNGNTFTRGPINPGYVLTMRDEGEKYVLWLLKRWFVVFGNWNNAEVELMFDSRDHRDDFSGNVSVWSVDIEPHLKNLG